MLKLILMGWMGAVMAFFIGCSGNDEGGLVGQKLIKSDYRVILRVNNQVIRKGSCVAIDESDFPVKLEKKSSGFGDNWEDFSEGGSILSLGHYVIDSSGELQQQDNPPVCKDIPSISEQAQGAEGKSGAEMSSDPSIVTGCQRTRANPRGLCN